ncbi:MAG: sucrase ferredoxin, partial [Pseudomonadales bacterium]
MSERVYCSEESRAVGEPIYGTADHVHVWLLLEYRPIWRARAIEDNDLPAAASAWLERSVEATAAVGLNARTQFLRQDEHDGEAMNLFVALADDRQSHLYHFALENYDALTAIDLGDLLQTPQRYDDHQQSEPLVLVCTNGQRDLCCARFGRPVFDHLSERFGARVWQTTHLGGHRFAPNVALMPEGLVYGRVDLDVVDALMDAHHEGRMKPELLRGRSC